MLRPNDEGDVSTLRGDLSFLLLLGFVAVVVLLLAIIGQKIEREADAAVLAPGDVLVDIRWPDGSPADVDLWVQAPGDRPVGYSNKSGRFFDLLRDDLGSYNDPAPANFENAATRGAAAGEYTVNLHLFSRRGGPLPLAVAVTVRIGEGKTTRLVWQGTVDLTRQGEEITAVRFSLDDQARVVPGSIHNLLRPLRSATP